MYWKDAGQIIERKEKLRPNFWEDPAGTVSETMIHRTQISLLQEPSVENKQTKTAAILDLSHFLIPPKTQNLVAKDLDP